MKGGVVLALTAFGLVALLWMRPGPARGPAPRAAGSERASSAPAGAELASPERVGESVPAEELNPPGPASTPDASAAAATAKPADALLGCVLYGRVRTRDGSSFAGWKPYVAATDAAGTRRQTEVTAEGHYSLAGLAPGSWTLSWRATGFRGGEEELVLDESVPILRRDLSLPRSPLLDVRVLAPSGETLAAVCKARLQAKLPELLSPIVVATLEAPEATIAVADDEGHVGVGTFWTSGPLWEAAGPDIAGVLELEVEPPLYVSLVLGTQVLATEAVAPGAEEVVFVVLPEDLLAKQALVTLRAVDADSGEPLGGEVSIDSRARYAVRDGTWSHSFTPGRYELCFLSQGHAVLPLDVTLAPGETRDLGELRLPRELTIEGRLLDADGNPVVGHLQVGVRDERGKLRFRQDPYSYPESDARGSFKVWGLHSGRYVLHTTHDEELVRPAQDGPSTVWVSGNVEVSTLGGSVTGLDLRLVKAGILVLKGVAALPPDSLCKILDERGDLLRYSGFYPGFVPRFALPPGPYTFVQCDGEWRELARHALVIGPGLNELDLTP